MRNSNQTITKASSQIANNQIKSIAKFIKNSSNKTDIATTIKETIISSTTKFIKSTILPLSLVASISILGGCSSKSNTNNQINTNSNLNIPTTFLALDGSKGFAGDSSKSPNELNAPDRDPNLTSDNQRPLLKASMQSDEFTPPLSLRSLDSGIPLIVNLNRPNENYNWNLREVKAFNPSIISSIKAIDNFKNLKFEYIQFVSAGDINQCLAIDESGLFTLKSCSNDLDTKKFETVYQLIPMNTDAVQIRSLVLNGKECISTFENPNLEPWQRVGINRCTLDETFIADIKRLWAIMPELRAATVLLPLE